MLRRRTELGSARRSSKGSRSENPFHTASEKPWYRPYHLWTNDALRAANISALPSPIEPSTPSCASVIGWAKWASSGASSKMSRSMYTPPNSCSSSRRITSAWWAKRLSVLPKIVAGGVTRRSSSSGFDFAHHSPVGSCAW